MITDNYIKMCEQAEEIQKAWKPKDWDRFIFKNDKSVGVGSGHIKSYMKIWYIWLPTQEQLQEMILTKNILENTWALGWLMNNVYCFMENKYEYVELPEHYAFKIFTAMNELWLAFVMYRKYNKIWTGEKWIQKNRMISECEKVGKKIIEDSHKIR